MRLHGKGDKWRACPLWQQTARTLTPLLELGRSATDTTAAVFSAHGRPLTRSGSTRSSAVTPPASTTHARPTVGPHIFRHTAAVHLLEAGVEVNVIRGWLGHADLTTTNRYAEINTKTKLAALRATEPPDFRRDPHHANLADRRDTAQLALLALTVMCPTARRDTANHHDHVPHHRRGHITGSGTEHGICARAHIRSARKSEPRPPAAASDQARSPRRATLLSRNGTTTRNRTTPATRRTTPPGAQHTTGPSP